MSRPIDLLQLGLDRVICAWEADGLVVDPGPESRMETLLEGLGGAAPRALLLTHIHLDHAGASGALVRRFPDLEVYVHERGAPHMVDPSKLVRSATQLYGDDMERLWGEVVPVPEDRVVPLADAETLDAAGHVLSVLFTPGHASHHVAYWEPELGAVFTGDVGGVRMPGADFALPPAPPPDLAPDDWVVSTDRLRQTGPRRMYLTHGGPIDDVSEHLDQLMPNLAAAEDICREAMLAGADDEEVIELLQTHTEGRIGAAVTELPGIVQRYGWASPSFLSALGFRRLLARRGEIPKP